MSVLGYIHTSYGKKPLAEVKAGIARYRQWYGADGICFDEATNDDAGLPCHSQCRAAARAGHSKAVAVINPNLERAADLAGVAHYPASRFFHLIYAAPDAAAVREAVKLSKPRNTEWGYVTPDDLPNPWDTLPGSAYWTGELAALKSAK